MSKFWMSCVLSGVIGFCATTGWAAPVFDNAEWARVFDGASAFPEGTPTGPGAVMRDGIDRPFDLKNMSGVVFARSAIENHRTYAGQAVKDFLEATLKEARRLSGNGKFQIPVRALTFGGGKYPMPHQGGLLSVKLGAYVLEKGKSKVEPNAVFRRGAIVTSDEEDITVLLNKEYQAGVERRKVELAGEDPKTVKTLLNEIYKSARTKVMGLRKANVKAKKEARKEAVKEKQKLRKALQEDRKAQEAQAMAIEDDEEREAALVALYDAWADEDFKAAKERKGKAGSQNPEGLPIDMAATWTFIEAALTQTAVPVGNIALPPGLKAQVLSYAEEKTRPSSVISKAEQHITTGAFEITLPCVLRDRFLGCRPSKYIDDPIADSVNKTALRLLDAAASLSEEDQIRALDMVDTSEASLDERQLESWLNHPRVKVQKRASRIIRKQERRDKLDVLQAEYKEKQSRLNAEYQSKRAEIKKLPKEAQKAKLEEIRAEYEAQKALLKKERQAAFKAGMASTR